MSFSQTLNRLENKVRVLGHALDAEEGYRTSRDKEQSVTKTVVKLAAKKAEQYIDKEIKESKRKTLMNSAVGFVESLALAYTDSASQPQLTLPSPPKRIPSSALTVSPLSTIYSSASRGRGVLSPSLSAQDEEEEEEETSDVEASDTDVNIHLHQSGGDSEVSSYSEALSNAFSHVSYSSFAL